MKSEEQRQMELIGAECVKLTLELVAAIKGEPINDVPVEAFLSEGEEQIL
jgi:hypothetical protein